MYSYAPIEQLVAPRPGRTKPRWSRLFTGAAAQMVSLPALTAGLPARSAMVWVGPPLLAKPAGSSRGLVAGPTPHVPSESRLWPPSVIVPEQFPPGWPLPGELLLATIVLVTVTVPEKL